MIKVRSLALAVALAYVASISTSTAYAADAKKSDVVEDKAQTFRGEGKDPNIKTAESKNDAKKEAKAPAHKGGEKTRGEYCGIVVDNWTPWFIDIYVDGDYEGKVGPWGDGSTVAISGATTVYARAEFDDGSSKTWGPRVFNCQGVHTWKLSR